MEFQNNEQTIRHLWSLMSDQKWIECKALFHPEFIAEWPQSRERFIGADSFIDMNSTYPGNHKIEILKIICSVNTVVSAVYVYADTGQKAFATSFFEIKDDKVLKVTEFWGEPYDSPKWRQKFSQKY